MMNQNKCMSIECIFSEKNRKGLCVGVSSDTRSFSKDVVRMCWVGRKPTQGLRCDVNTQAQMTPAEAVAVGVSLIRSSIVGETLLERLKMEEANAQKETTPKA